MLKVIDHHGRSHRLNPELISSVAETGTSSQWHGINSIIRMADGQVIEARTTVAEIDAQQARGGAQ